MWPLCDTIIINQSEKGHSRRLPRSRRKYLSDRYIVCRHATTTRLLEASIQYREITSPVFITRSLHRKKPCNCFWTCRVPSEYGCYGNSRTDKTWNAIRKIPKPTSTLNPRRRKIPDALGAKVPLPLTNVWEDRIHLHLVPKLNRTSHCW